MTHRGLVFTILKVLRTLDTKEYSCLVSLYIHIICFFLVTSAFRQMQTEITFRFRVTPSRIAENNFKNDITFSLRFSLTDGYPHLYSTLDRMCQCY